MITNIISCAKFCRKVISCAELKINTLDSLLRLNMLDGFVVLHISDGLS